MTFSSSLSVECHSTLVLDTSVIINLGFCRIGNQILQVIDNRFVITNRVAFEIVGAVKGSIHAPSKKFKQELVDANILSVINLSLEEATFSDYLTKMQDSIDDGEASTIALAAQRGFVPVIDEKRGRARASIELSNSTVGRSLDVILHPTVRSHFDESEVQEAVYFAMKNGRMHISPVQVQTHVEPKLP